LQSFKDTILLTLTGMAKTRKQKVKEKVKSRDRRVGKEQLRTLSQTESALPETPI